MAALISYDFLLKNPYTSHVEHFSKIFKRVKIDAFLEFGMGLGTKYFLEHCREVTSLEFLISLEAQEWYNFCRDLFDGYQNWHPILHPGSDNIQKAHYIRGNKKDPALESRTYLEELKKICEELMVSKSFEMAFVDCGFFPRADIVNILLGKIPIIAAHDTMGNVNIYGWDKILNHADYKIVHFTNGTGITFWIKRDRQDVMACFL